MQRTGVQRVARWLAAGFSVAAVVAASLLGLHDWADMQATKDVAQLATLDLPSSTQR